jgi:hypothetical protein
VKTARWVPVLALAGLLAGCGSAAATGGSQGTASTPAAGTPAAAWVPGGAYTGPVPPAGLLGPVHGWQLAPYTNPDGYKVQDRIDFGVPLHFRIPNRVKDCFSAYDYTYDLKPGQFAVPFAITVKNLLPQQGVAITPGMYATYDGQPDSYGQVTSQSLDVTSVGSALWGDGTCSSDTRQTPPAGGTVVMYGFIGPGTVQQLQAATIKIQWEGGDYSAPAPLTLPLHSLLPHAAASWLIAQGG